LGETPQGTPHSPYGALWNTGRDHSGLMFANFTTLAHFSVSSAMSLPKSAGEPGSTVICRDARSGDDGVREKLAARECEGSMSRHTTAIVVIVMLIAMVAILTSAVVRLESYRYANFVGACTEFDITKPQQRIEREKCLEATQTRTHWFWHVLYGVGFL
jgi:hypothetical protein